MLLLKTVSYFCIFPNERTVSANFSLGITALFLVFKRLLYTVCGEQCRNSAILTLSLIPNLTKAYILSSVLSNSPSLRTILSSGRNRELKCNSTHCPILLKRKMYTDIVNKPNSRAASLGKALRKLKIMGNTSYWCPPWIFIINSSTGRVMWANTNTYEISKQSYEHISASLAFVACTEGNGSKKVSLHSVRVENRDLLDGIQVDKVRKVTNSEAIFDVLDEKTNKKFTLLVNDLGNVILTAYASYISTNITDKHVYLNIDLQGSIKTLKLSWNYDILRVPTGVFAIKLR